MKGVRGRVSALWLAYCGRCDADPWQDTTGGSRRAFVAALRRAGWRTTVRDGWVCPDCRRPPAEPDAGGGVP